MRSAAASIAAAGALAALALGAPVASAATVHVANTEQLEAAVKQANSDNEANNIVLAGGPYTPGATITLTDKTGIQTFEGGPGLSTTHGPEILGQNVVPEPSELLVVGEGVSAAFRWVTLGVGGGLAVPSVVVAEHANLTLEEAGVENSSGNAVVVHAGATASAVNSTLSGTGGGDGLVNNGTASLVNSTVAFNERGGIANEGTLNLTNTIVGDNTALAFPDCSGHTPKTNDHNLDSDGTCGVGALSGVNPKIKKQPLFDGGPTRVQSLMAGSPAINAGDATMCPPVDQRGAKRPTGECDVGADQYSATLPTLTVPTQKLVKEAESAAGATVEYTVGASAVEAEIEELTCVAPATKKPYPAGKTMALFPVGLTKVTCTAVDGHENKVEKSFEVEVTPQSTTTTTTTTTTPTTTTSTTTTTTTTTTTNPTTTTTTTTVPTTTTTTTPTTTTTTRPTTTTTTTSPTTTTTSPTTTTTSPTTATTSRATTTTSSSATSPTPSNTTSSATTSSATTSSTTSTHGPPPPETPAASLRRLLGEIQSSKIARHLRQQLSSLLSKALRALEASESHVPPTSAVRAAALSEWSWIQQPLAPLAHAAAAKRASSRERSLQQACSALTQFVTVVERAQHKRKPQVPAGLARSWTRTARNIETSAGCQSVHKSSGHSHGKSGGHSGHHHGR